MSTAKKPTTKRGRATENAPKAPAPAPVPMKRRRMSGTAFIEDKEKRDHTFYKRRNGLFKKAEALAALVDSQVMVIVAANSGRIFSFGTPRFEPVLGDAVFRTLIQRSLAPPVPDALENAPESSSSSSSSDSSSSVSSSSSSSDSNDDADAGAAANAQSVRS